MTQTKDKLDPYQQAIKDYLDKRAEEDPAFAEKYRAGLAGKKDIRACCNYIIDQVKKTGRRGFSDPEIYGMAMHFYDEDSVEAPKSAPSCTVVVNQPLAAPAKAEKKEAPKAPAVNEKALRAQIRKEEREKARKEEAAKKKEAARKAQEKRKADEARKKEQAEKRALEAGPLLFDFS